MIQLISETTLKKRTVVNENVNAKYINPSIETAQEMGLQPLIGTVLYKKLCELVTPVGNPPTMPINDPANAAYKILLDDYITPYLCNKTLADLQVALFAKVRNEGIVTSQDQQTQQLSKGEVDFIKEHYDNRAIFYGNRLIDYLHANSNRYPEWLKRETMADMPSNPKAFNAHIVL